MTVFTDGSLEIFSIEQRQRKSLDFASEQCRSSKKNSQPSDIYMIYIFEKVKLDEVV